MAKILLTGGAGYIGSHTYAALVAAGHDVVIFDNFSNARAGAPVSWVKGDVLDPAALAAVFADHAFDAVVHFAALKAVAQSVAQPLAYFRTNIGGLLNLVDAMDGAGVRRLVFSSSATVYGEPDQTPTPETAPRRAMNPYGQTKITGEEMLEQLAQSDPRWAVGILRYFNPAGAHGSALIGEDPSDIPNNLMPYIARLALGDLDCLSVFGDDYDTSDGTGMRDYIHVEDLARGHALSLAKLLETGQGHLVNLGTGQGSSVLEVHAAYEAACGKRLPYKIAPRRPGDVPIYCADPAKARAVLGFEAEKDLAAMCASSWAWISRRGNG
ncbi:UNVERIFIED_CONTAM: hypothetical protein GTU68_055606 [Idotea baltica]|nr:hypothetical protein [Idotea baltica]